MNPDPDHEARAHVEGRRRPAPGAEDENWLTPEEEAEIVADINSGRFPYLLPVAEQPAGRHPTTFTYLASPYSKLADKGAAAAIVARAAAHLMRNGEVVYSPIVHGHAVATHGLPLDWEFWKAQCQPFVALADKLVVLEMDGWRESTGVQWEIGEFRRAGKPVEFMGLDALVRGSEVDRRAA